MHDYPFYLPTLKFAALLHSLMGELTLLAGNNDLFERHKIDRSGLQWMWHFFAEAPNGLRSEVEQFWKRVTERADEMVLSWGDTSSAVLVSHPDGDRFPSGREPLVRLTARRFRTMRFRGATSRRRASRRSGARASASGRSAAAAASRAPPPSRRRL